jgi:branched-chain amino acid transport system substrate-binding protein
MKKKSMIVFMLMVAFVTLCVFTIAFAGEFRIGLLFPQTGQHAIWGKYQAQGAEIAQDIINERGGIKGNKIVYVKVDASDPTVAASECTRLITQEKVKLIIGSGIAGNATAATGVADKAKVAYYETTTATSPITERGFRYTFRSVFKASMAGERLTEFIYEYLPKLMGKGPKDLKIVVAHEDGPLGSSLCEGIKTGAKSKGLELPVVLTYSAKSSDLSS